MEQFKNFAITSLNGSINNTTTSITVTDASKLSSTGTFAIIIDSEIILVNSVSGNVLTVVRGSEGTTAVSHTNGTSVYQVITKRTLEQFRTDNIGSNTFANVISNIRAGRIFIPNNSDYLVRDNGSALQYFYKTRPQGPALDTGFSWVNQGGATLNSASGLLHIHAPATAGESLRIRIKSMTPPYSAIAKVTTHFTSNNTPNAGIGFYETSTQKISTISIARSTNLKLFTYKWTNPTTFSASYTNTEIWYAPSKPIWLKITDDNTNITFGYGYDGINFTTMTNVARNNFFTTGPSHFMFYVNAVNATNAAQATMWHFKEGT